MDDDSQQVRELSERIERIYEVLDKLDTEDAAFMAAELGIKYSIKEVTL